VNGRAGSRRRAPLVAIVPAGLATALLLLPLLGLVRRAAWSGLLDDLADPLTRDALRLSLECAALATAIAILLGTPLAWVLARYDFPGRTLLRALALLPLVVPPVVGGVALLLAFGREGIVGGLLDDIGVQLTFHPSGVVLAETFVAMPFLVVTLEAAFRSIDRRYEEVAETLGASRATVFRRVTLRAVAPAMVAGAALAWARALGEFGATITFAGSISGRTQTLPLAVYQALETNPSAAITLSLVLLGISIAVLVLLRGRWWGLGSR
jgi:molybdate transport system permease protein